MKRTKQKRINGNTSSDDHFMQRRFDQLRLLWRGQLQHGPRAKRAFPSR